MPTSPARTADDLADNIRSMIDRIVEARFTQEMAKRGSELGDLAEEAWRDSAPARRDAAKRAARAAHEATDWSETTWRKTIRPLLKDVWSRRTAAAGAAAAAVPAGRELVDTAKVRMGLKQREERHWGAFFLGLLLGAATGAIVALLTAPKRGDEMRHELGVRADEVRREVGQRTDEITAKARDEWVPMFQRQVGNGHGDEAAESMDEATENLHAAAAEAGAAGGEAMEHVADETGDAADEALEPADQDRPT